MGKVRIFCDCGKEIWDWPDAVVRLGRGDRINDIERDAICSDCLMDQTTRRIAAMRREAMAELDRTPPPTT